MSVTRRKKVSNCTKKTEEAPVTPPPTKTKVWFCSFNWWLFIQYDFASWFVSFNYFLFIHLYEKCTNQEACTSQSGGNGEADSCRRKGQAEIHLRKQVSSAPACGKRAPIPGAIFEEEHLSFS
ncbi:hypothetical protein AB990_16090 [Alkalihalobacillus pseudalcaliphilus]|nr:hypothetical protein AB990_16090 [Alkalihalobacillus pseudalcaliphilus]